jgi:hypothetical protein
MANEVDKVHQPKCYRQTARQHEQQHAVGNSIEQNGQHVGVLGGPRGTPYDHLLFSVSRKAIDSEFDAHGIVDRNNGARFETKSRKFTR